MKHVYKRYAEYPQPDEQRSGCKVGWYIYRDPDQAKRCSAAAKQNGRIKAGMGFDFGFQAPGSITKLSDGRFEVCIP